MNIEFHWAPQSNPESQEIVEREIFQIIQDRDIKPCHPGAISVSLVISGPLDTKLQGSAKCKCGKTLMTFKGDDNASCLELTENK
ncbi:MAG: hypothetical protein U9N83_03295 [Thermodesulfobacteriota bacterium]|nr:hypothetical protein [Thermodesulfobacteriota bacterium]